ncbi:MAG: hypothetical protein BWY88_00343 [Synergistetes bacterium ADurb.Bin520]|nr:MAG: hypothetical protein BWY88_00343 [Synergistetes bacterium ADurb.Bin520]
MGRANRVFTTVRTLFFPGKSAYPRMNPKGVPRARHTAMEMEDIFTVV